MTKKWAEDEDNTYKTRPQTKQSGADWETSFLIQRKSGADGWETVKTYSGSADAPLIITLYGKNAEAQATGSVSGLPSGEYRAVELQPGYDAGKPEGSIIAPDAGEEAVYNKAYTAAYEFDPGKNATTVTNTLNTVQYGLQKKWANNDHGNIASVTVELQYQAADDKWTSFSEVTLDGTADDAAGKSCYEDAAWHALWTAVPEYLPGSMTDKSGHTLYRIVEKDGKPWTVEVTEASQWKGIFEDLPKYDAAEKEIQYSVKEESVGGEDPAEKFETTYGADEDAGSLTVTNKLLLKPAAGPDDKTESTSDQPAKTGDTTDITLAAALVMISLAGGVTVILMRRNRKKTK